MNGHFRLIAPFRRISYVGMACGAHFKGLGFEGYRRAIRWLCGL